MTAGETFGRTIQLFLVDGKPTGLRKATIHGWTGLLFVSGASAAAAVVLDRNSNGQLERKVRGSKLNYHEWQQAQAGGTEVTE